jgi:hypothetical protein
MKLDLIFGFALGVGVGYLLAKKVDDLPRITSSGKPLTGRESLNAAYHLGVTDGKSGKVYAGNDVIGYLQSIS